MLTKEAINFTIEEIKQKYKDIYGTPHKLFVTADTFNLIKKCINFNSKYHKKSDYAFRYNAVIIIITYWNTQPYHDTFIFKTNIIPILSYEERIIKDIIE